MAKFRGVRPRRNDESDYFRRMSAAYLRPFLAGMAAHLASLDDDASTSEWLAAVGTYVDRWVRQHEDEFPDGVVRRWAQKLDRYHADRFSSNFWRVARVDVREQIRGVADDVMRARITENIRLIKTIPGRFQDDMVDAMVQGEREAPLDLQARSAIFKRTGHSAGYNLRRITRDQSNKWTGQLSEIRQTSLGILRYTWSTSEDDRVRPTHAEKDARVFSWENPPSDTGHPGNDIQCRCIAQPVITLNELRGRFGVGIDG